MSRGGYSITSGNIDRFDHHFFQQRPRPPRPVEVSVLVKRAKHCNNRRPRLDECPVMTLHIYSFVTTRCLNWNLRLHSMTLQRLEVSDERHSASTIGCRQSSSSVAPGRDVSREHAITVTIAPFVAWAASVPHDATTVFNLTSHAPTPDKSRNEVQSQGRKLPHLRQGLLQCDILRP